MSRVLITMPMEMAVRIHEHRVTGRFRSENAAMVHLIEQGLDWLENQESYREQEAQLRRLRLWGQSIP